MVLTRLKNFYWFVQSSAGYFLLILVILKHFNFYISQYCPSNWFSKSYLNHFNTFDWVSFGRLYKVFFNIPKYFWWTNNAYHHFIFHYLIIIYTIQMSLHQFVEIFYVKNPRQWQMYQKRFYKYNHWYA